MSYTSEAVRWPLQTQLDVQLLPHSLHTTLTMQPKEITQSKKPRTPVRLEKQGSGREQAIPY